MFEIIYTILIFIPWFSIVTIYPLALNGRTDIIKNKKNQFIFFIVISILGIICWIFPIINPKLCSSLMVISGGIAYFIIQAVTTIAAIIMSIYIGYKLKKLNKNK